MTIRFQTPKQMVEGLRGECYSEESIDFMLARLAERLGRFVERKDERRSG